MKFKWHDWNIAKCGQHGVDPAEAEYVVRNARAPYPRHIDHGKWLVWGRDFAGRCLQVIFVLDEPDECVFIIHARPLEEREKRSFRRRMR